MSQLYFFRHAQASYLADNYDQLSPLGEQQSLELGKYLVKKDIHFDKFFVGPLQRQKHTFEIVVDVLSKHKKNIPEAISLEGLREHLGPRALRHALPELIKTDAQVRQWYKEIEANPALRKKNNLLAFRYFMNKWVVEKIKVEDVQSWQAFRQKVKEALSTILEHTEKGERIACFTSGGTIAAITAEALSLQDELRVASMNFSIRNTSFTRFLSSNNEFNLFSFNELPHLKEEFITFV